MQRILLIVHTTTLVPYPYNAEGEFYNSGNQVFINAIISYFYSKNINCIVKSVFDVAEIVKKDPNWAKENFDFAIMHEANIFAEAHIMDMKLKIIVAKGLHIPLFVLGAGAQSSSDYSFTFLSKIESIAKEYLDAIFYSGGNITLRGYFTQEVLNRLGYKDCFVSGCPSLYYNGRNFSISNDKVTEENFLPIFNGNIKNIITYCNKSKKNNSFFYDQQEFYKIIWRSDLLNKNEFNKIVKNYERYNLLKNNQIRLFYDYKAWEDDLQKKSPHFSFGQRVHGNLIALINNIPSFIDVIDSRTREIAEFYKIPNSISIPFNFEKDNLYDLYLSLDWREFNENFKRCYDNFEKFFVDNNITMMLGKNEEYKEEQKKLSYSSPKISTNQVCLKYEKEFKRYQFIKKYFLRRWIARLLCFFIPMKQVRKLIRQLYIYQ